jgi:hypothetical protein
LRDLVPALRVCFRRGKVANAAVRVAREEGIRANARLIDEVGAEQWLTSLLEVLEGDYPRGQDGAAFGFTRTPPRRS